MKGILFAMLAVVDAKKVDPPAPSTTPTPLIPEVVPNLQS